MIGLLIDAALLALIHTRIERVSLYWQREQQENPENVCCVNISYVH